MSIVIKIFYSLLLIAAGYAWHWAIVNYAALTSGENLRSFGILCALAMIFVVGLRATKHQKVWKWTMSIDAVCILATYGIAKDQSSLGVLTTMVFVTGLFLWGLLGDDIAEALHQLLDWDDRRQAKRKLRNADRKSHQPTHNSQTISVLES